MKFNPEIHHRRSIRLKEYDYARAGAYFVTICVQDRERLFGTIVGEEMVLSSAGRMVQTVWDEMPKFYAGIRIDTFQIMPNHIHGIVILVGAPPCGCPTVGGGCPAVDGGCPTVDGCPDEIDQINASREARYKNTSRGNPIQNPIQNPGQKIGQARGPAPTLALLALPDVMHRFKTLTTKRYVDGVHQHNWASFPGKLWQRNYYEHIIRDENEWRQVREYITNNPMKWALDRENPDADISIQPQKQDEPWQT